jgi:hypothetical protein
MPTGYVIYGPLPWRRPVESVLNDPPSNPTLGISYIVGASPSGAWIGYVGNIARWSGVAWVYEAPLPGWRTYIKSTDTHQVYKSGGWENWAVPSGEGGTPTGQLDGGTPTSEFGGTEPIDGGGV